MKVTVDTNILVRAVTKDNALQSASADKILREADVLAVTLPTLCEFVWVLRNGYKLPCNEIALAIRALMESANVTSESRAVAAGLKLLDAGGDFADGVIAFQGLALGGEIFASYDKSTVEKLTRQGIQSLLIT